MNHRSDMPVESEQPDPRPFLSSGFSDDEIMMEVNRLVERMNRTPEFVRQLAGFRGATLVLSATDTGRELMITLDGHGVRIQPHADEPFDAKIEATEQVHWAVLSGQMDADAAFFSKNVRIRGSLITAFRVKNRFLSFLQWCLAGESRATAKFPTNR